MQTITTTRINSILDERNSDMKKFIVMAVLFLALPAVSFAAYGTGDVDLGSDADNTLTVSTSNQVYVDYAQNNSGDTFALATYHDKGTRTYMSSSEDANIYYSDSTETAVPTAPAIGTSLGETSDFGSTL